MIVHLFTIENNYNYAFLEFVHKNNLFHDRIFIFRHPSTGKFNYPVEIKSRIRYAGGALKLITVLLPALWKSKWNYIHYLPYGPTLFLLALLRSSVKKSTWIIWGGDVYIYENKNNSFKSQIYEFLRKIIIINISEIAALVKNDFDICQQVYHAKGIHIPLTPLNPAGYDIYRKTDPAMIHDPVTVLLGNSADPSNNHIEIINKLSRFRDENIKIFCVLSYGGSKNYINKIIELGNSILGDKFTAVLQYMSVQDYVQFISGMDIGIMNHQRQQGLGNIFPLLIMKKKIFLKKDSAAYHYFIDNSCTIYDAITIDELTFNDFIKKDKVILEKNAEIINKITDNDIVKKSWIDFLERH
jgi:dTDP-N-acetylfucosamine:lipid II N-acetylfucosaminyltransferase